MSDSKKNPQPPPDDYSKTTPDINLPKEDKAADWEKTNYGFSPQPPAEDWGKTVANFNVPSRNGEDESDFSKTQQPSHQPKASDDWGMTQANVNVPADFGNKPEDYSEYGEKAVNYEFTTPLIRLPEAERAKYQNLPPTPAEEAARQKEEEKKGIGGIPNWVWIAAGLMSMFFFAVVVIIGAYLILSRTSSFDVVVKLAPARSDIKVNGIDWGIPADDSGTIKLPNLAAETKRIEIIHPSYVCEPREIDGAKAAGETVEITAACQPKKVAPGEDCGKIGIGEEDKAERCARAALDALPDPPPVDDLINALNLFIINFESGKFNIPDERMDFLKRAASYIQKLPPTTVIEIGGHTDSVGTNDSNQTLSDNRARSVRNALIGFGVKPEMLTEKGYGETRLKFPEERNDVEKFKNRRIEYSVVKR